MMSTIDLSDDHRFIDININDNDSDTLPTNEATKSPEQQHKNSFFNFIHNSPKYSNTSKILRKTKSESLKSPALPVLTQSASSPIDYVPDMYKKKSPEMLRKSSQVLSQAADILLSNLDEIDLNSSENSDEDEELRLSIFDDEKLIELNKNVQQLKRNSFLSSTSFNSLKESSSQSFAEHSTPLAVKTNDLEKSADADDLDKTLNSETNGNTLLSPQDSQIIDKSELSYNYSEDKHLAAYKETLNKKLLCKNDSIVDDLLGDIYDRFNVSFKESFNESELFSELSMSSSTFPETKSWILDSDLNEPNEKYYGKSYHSIKTSLKKLDVCTLRRLVSELTLKSNQTSAKLIRNLRQKDKLALKLDKNCDIITSILQARSLKRRVDTKMKFTIDPVPGSGESGFIQWKDAMKALTRLPNGVPKEFRKSVWLNLSKQYIKDINLDWNKVRRIAFNERSNPDDHELGIQIVKDLHRTGCSAFSGQDNEQDRALLKRVLLAFARYNKSVGYCQGFNIIAAQILEIVDKKEEDAFMCMIYLIDHILPEGYFTNSMHSLAIDMAVFRELLKRQLPKLCQHLNALQFNSITESSSPLSIFSNKKSKASNSKKAPPPKTCSTYEPPLTNVFTMQWFLTLFATCLPKNVLLHVWDCLFLEGAEILFRTSMAIWDKLSVSVMKANSADSFYSMMSVLTVRLFDKGVLNENDLMNKIFSYGPFPLAGLEDLRENLTFNITPFQQMCLPNSKENKSRNNGESLSNIKLRNKNESKLISTASSSNINEQTDDLELSSRKTEGTRSAKYYYNEENDDDEAEDLAKMISCFALLMPNRSIGSSSTPQKKTMHSASNDIMIHAAAAASAYGSKLVSKTTSKEKTSKSELEIPQKLDDYSSVTPGAFSYITQMYNPKPLGDHLTSDLNELKQQYKKLKERQRQAHVIIQSASDKHRKSLMNRSVSSSSSGINTCANTPASQRRSIFAAGKSMNSSNRKDSINHIGTDLMTKIESPFSPSSELSPIVNHLLIKPDDLKCNTVKKSITLINHPNHTVGEANFIDPYANMQKCINSFNNDCENYEKTQSAQKKPVKKPYYSDDESDDDSDDLVEIDSEKSIGLSELSFKQENIANNNKQIQNLNLLALCDKPAASKLRSVTSSSSEDSVFNKDSYLQDEKEMNSLDSTSSQKSPSKLSPKKRHDSKLVIRQLVNEEKRQMTPFNPFPIRQLNANVAKNGMRLGLYK